jgi:hypothetical protein
MDNSPIAEYHNFHRDLHRERSSDSNSFVYTTDKKIISNAELNVKLTISQNSESFRTISNLK